MIDLTNFRKYKLIYLIIIMSAMLITAFHFHPLYNEAFIDITIKPPEDIRKTDFSWITVGEWFNTQARLITSYSILEEVKTDIGREKLRKIVSARRVGSSDVIRISARSGEEIERLKALAGEIAGTYLKKLGETQVRPVTKKVETGDSKREEMYNGLLRDRLKQKGALDALSKRLNSLEAELKILRSGPSQAVQIKERLGEINRSLIPLKTEMDGLKATYTDNWPAVQSLKTKIGMLEAEREKLNNMLPAAQKLEDKRSYLAGKIAGDRKNAGMLQDELDSIDIRLSQLERQKTEMKQQTLPEPDVRPLIGRIITGPAQKIFPELGIRLAIAALLGVITWFLLGLFLENVYLFWVLKDRLFKKR